MEKQSARSPANDAALARAVQEVLLQRQREARLLGHLTGPQRAFVEDPSRQKAILAERQCGKTECCAV